MASASNRDPRAGTATLDPADSPFARLRAVTVEVMTKRNGNYLHPLFSDVLRGAWRKTELHLSEMDEFNYAMPDHIPGQHICVDPSRRTARLFDPIDQPEYRHVLERFERRNKDSAVKNLLPTKITGRREVRLENLGDTQLKSHIFTLARMVEADLGRVVEGALPTFAEIALLPGKIRIGTFENGSKPIKYREDLPPDEVEYRPMASVKPTSPADAVKW